QRVAGQIALLRVEPRHARPRGGTPGGTRTPNLRFWRPLLCQLSYWRIEKIAPFRKRQRRLAPPALVPTRLAACRNRIPAVAGMTLHQPCAPGRARGVTSLDDLGHHAGADGTAAFADREAQAFVHR